MEDLRGKSLGEIETLFAGLNLPRYKAKELFRQIHGSLKEEIDQITALNLAEREKLKQTFTIERITVEKKQAEHEVEKAAFKLSDGCFVETVLMQYEGERNTVCVSSQSGCAVGCQFCATGRMGIKRNLSVGEILAQVYFFAKRNPVSNIVFMGMGEPFLNYNHVMKAIGILNAELGQNIAKRKIVISTVGIIPGIIKFSREPGQIRLAWSLVAPLDHLRRELIKMTGLPSIDTIVRALKDYQKSTKRRITVEYIILGGVNDGLEEIGELIKITKKLDCHVNLIPYNFVAGSRFRAGNVEKVYERLKKAKVNVTRRRSLGDKIKAACGQLGHN